MAIRIIIIVFFTDASVMAAADLFGLDGQIEHKLAFLREHIPRVTRLVLVGHSIGCYIILEMMKRDPELQVRLQIFSGNEPQTFSVNGLEVGPSRSFLGECVFCCCCYLASTDAFGKAQLTVMEANGASILRLYQEKNMHFVKLKVKNESSNIFLEVVCIDCYAFLHSFSQCWHSCGTSWWNSSLNSS